MRFAAALLCLHLGVASAAAPPVRASAERFVLGTDGGVFFGAEVGVRAIGTAGTLTAVDGGFAWSPPAARYPQRAVFAFFRDGRGNELPEVAVKELVLLGRTELSIDTEPNASVRVEVAGRSFGPITANKKGRAKVEIEVPPDATTAQVISEVEGVSKRREAPLSAPKAESLAVAITPEPAPSSGGRILVVANHVVAQGSLQVAVSGGRAGPLRTAGFLSTAELFPSDAADVVQVVVRRADKKLEGSAAAAVIRTVVPPQLPEDAGFSAELADAGTDGGEAPVARSGFVLGAGVGAWFGGGDVIGFTVEGSGGYLVKGGTLPLFVELGGGLRIAEVAGTLPSVGSVTSRIQAIPVHASLRARAARGAGALDLRAGAGLAIYDHQIQGPFLTTTERTQGVGPEVFGGVAGSYLYRQIEVFLELRAGLSPSTRARIPAQAGGGVILVGARFLP